MPYQSKHAQQSVITKLDAQHDRVSGNGLTRQGHTAAASINHTDNHTLTFYPAYCYKVSPTWFAWVKITAYEVHHVLKHKPEYQSAVGKHDRQNHFSTGARQPTSLLLFYHNHPVQFVQLTGVVVAFEEYLERIWLFTVDDSSGRTIEVTCPKPEQKATINNTAANPATLHTNTTSAAVEVDTDALNRQAVLSHSSFGPGTVITVKGTLTAFRSNLQLNLSRIAILADTTAELRQIASRAAFHITILSRPWTVSDREQEKLHKAGLGEVDRADEAVQKSKERAARKRDRDKRDQRKIERAYARDEKRREEQAELAREHGRALKRVKIGA